MYEAVWQRLKEDGCVGIFPEVKFTRDFLYTFIREDPMIEQ